MPVQRRIFAALLLLAAGLAPRLALAQALPPPRGSSIVPGDPAVELQRDVAAIDAFGPDRSVGTPGAHQTADYLADRLAQATGQKVWRQGFRLAAPIRNYSEAFVPTLEGQPPGQHYGLWPWTPAGGQPPALPGNQATAGVVYVQRGLLDQLKGKTLAGQWIAMDLERADWQTLASLGARGIIFLGRPDSISPDFTDKWTSVPIGLPRFYTDDPALIAGIKDGSIKDLTIRVNVTWVDTPAENLLCLIPGRQTTPDLLQRRIAAQDQRLGRPSGVDPKTLAGWTDQLVVLQARYDAASEVLGRSPGAQQAVNAAAVVDLARRIAAAPDHCSVLVALTAGDEWMQRGTRNLMELFRRENKDPALSLKELVQSGQKAEQAAAEVTALVAGLQQVGERGDLTGLNQSWRTVEDSAKNLTIADAIRDQLDRRRSELEEKLQRARLHDAHPERDPAFQAWLDTQADDLFVSTALQRQTALTKVGDKAIVSAMAREALASWTTERERVTARRDARRQWVEIRRAIGLRDPMVHLQVELTSGADRFGFFSRSFYTLQNDFAGRMQNFNQAFARYRADAADAARARGEFFTCQFDDNANLSDHSIEGFFSIRRGFSTDACLLRGQAAGAFATIADASGLLGTPNDTPDRLDWGRLARQFRDLYALLLGAPDRNPVGALTDPQFYGRTDLPNTTGDQKFTLLERTLSDTILRLGASEHLLGVEQPNVGGGGGWAAIPNLAGMRRMDWSFTHADGTITPLALVGGITLHLQAFQFNADSTPRRALAQTAGEQQAALVSAFWVDPKAPKRALVFGCQRLDLFGLFDPRYLDYLDRLRPRDALRSDDLKYSAAYVRDGVGCVFMEPEIRWQLLAAKGEVVNRVVLINMASSDDRHPEGGGFATVDRTELGPLVWQNVQDLYALDTQRQRNLEKHGIKNELLAGLQRETKTYLDKAQAGRDRKDYAAWLTNASAAWSLQSQVYAGLRATANGIIQGVIFLLLGLIPFSYFLERLVIGATNVYRQIGGFAAIFVVMTAGLWFHPAFRISSSPIIILLAFLILILSSTVVWILFGKFEEEIARLRGAGAASHTASLKRGAVLGAAVRLGLSNMRRRGTRTALTLVTLVILTFTLLCFTSVRESLSIIPRVVDTAPAHPATGILIRQRGWRTLPAETMTLVREIAGPHGRYAERWWAASENAALPWSIPVNSVLPDSPARPLPFTAAALVGLDPNEAAFQENLAQTLPGWEQLAAGRPVCFLPVDAIAASAHKDPNGRVLGEFHVGDRVEILGVELTIAGFFQTQSDPDKGLVGINNRLLHITGDEMTPVDPAGTAAPPGTTTATNPEDIAALQEQSYRYLVPNQVVFVPAPLARRLNARLTSVMVQPEPGTPIFDLAEKLSRRSAFQILASDGTQVRSYNSSASLQPENLSKVLIPMLIAAIIVLNTMLGAVAERTREIHVYTSLGLAPAHVGTLFLAEAAALGTLGVVFGYIFGQGLATILALPVIARHVNLMQGVDLNYSSMSAIVTMGLVLGIVMLSALWPARTASRIAAPSLQRDWKLPPAVGDLLQVDLPFTVNAVAARGVCAFLEEFLVTVSQAGSGRFTADHLQAFCQDTPAGEVRGLTCRVWLAPYDLGVIQAFWLAVHPTSEPNVFEVKLTLVREAGNPGTWHRLNRPFLVEVRKQFLLWRAVKPELVTMYVEKSAAMFAGAANISPPVTA